MAPKMAEEVIFSKIIDVPISNICTFSIMVLVTSLRCATSQCGNKATLPSCKYHNDSQGQTTVGLHIHILVEQLPSA